MKALFDNCVNSVVTLIDDQLDQLIRKGYEVRVSSTNAGVVTVKRLLTEIERVPRGWFQRVAVFAG